MKSYLENNFILQLNSINIDFTYQREYKFHPLRRWRFDFAYPNLKLAIEIEGGIYCNGAHVRGKHYESDCEKYNNAILLGWKVLRFTSTMIRNGQAIDFIQKFFKEVNL